MTVGYLKQDNGVYEYVIKLKHNMHNNMTDSNNLYDKLTDGLKSKDFLQYKFYPCLLLGWEQSCNIRWWMYIIQHETISIPEADCEYQEIPFSTQRKEKHHWFTWGNIFHKADCNGVVKRVPGCVVCR